MSFLPNAYARRMAVSGVRKSGCWITFAMRSDCSFGGRRRTAVFRYPFSDNSLVQNRMEFTGCCPNACSVSNGGLVPTGLTMHWKVFRPRTMPISNNCVSFRLNPFRKKEASVS